MAIVKKGSRRIVVDGTAYRWTVRSNPTYSQGDAWDGLSFAAQREESGQSILVANVGRPRPDNWMNFPGGVITPALVTWTIRKALAHGWRPTEKGGPYVFALPVQEDDHFYSV